MYTCTCPQCQGIASPPEPRCELCGESHDFCECEEQLARCSRGEHCEHSTCESLNECCECGAAFHEGDE